MANRFPQDPSRQEASVTEWIRLINKQKVQLTLEGEVLKTVIQYYHVNPKLLDRISTGIHSVLVSQNNGSGQITRQHEGLVSGFFGIQENFLPITLTTFGLCDTFLHRNPVLEESTFSSLLLYPLLKMATFLSFFASVPWQTVRPREFCRSHQRSNCQQR